MPVDEPPSVLDPEIYRSVNGDLSHMSDAECLAHFHSFGVSEGRVSSLGSTKESFVQHIVERHPGPKLEIGPFCNPVLRGADVQYFDVFDEVELRRRAGEMGLDTGGCPDKIDYTCPLSEIDRSFAAILSSHSIEHQPDLVSHLNDVAAKLEPGGRYYIVIPDKRYCFDARQAESTIGAVLQAHREKRSLHTYENVLNFLSERTHNDAVRHWAGASAPREEPSLSAAIAATDKHFAEANGNYIDTHAWQFTPNSFSEIIDALHAARLITLRAIRVYNTPRDRLEFCAILG